MSRPLQGRFRIGVSEIGCEVPRPGPASLEEVFLTLMEEEEAE